MSRKKLPDPSRKRISNKKLIDLLKSRQCTWTELIKLGVTKIQLTELENLHYNLTHQYDPGYKEDVYYILEKGEQPMIFLKADLDKPLRIGKMSDIHIGSKEVDIDELIKLLSYLKQIGIKIITISGDLTDGSKVYRGQIQNLDYPTLQRQAEAVVSVLSLFDFTYITVKGNHDGSSTNNAGVDVLSLVEQKMVNLGKDFTYLKSYLGYVIFNNVAIELIHMDGGNSRTSKTYGSQKMMDSIFDSSARMGNSNVNYVKIFNDMIPVVNVVTGHYHAMAKFIYGNVVVESPLCTQNTTDFIARRGLKSTTGARVSSLTIKNGKVISEKGYIALTSNLDELYNFHVFSKKINATQLTIDNLTDVKNNDDSINLDEETSFDEEKIRKALNILFKRNFCKRSEINLSDEEINHINAKYNYSIYVNSEDMVVLKTCDDASTVIFSTQKNEGTVKYLELSNLFIGSKYFNEEKFRKILDYTIANGTKHVYIAGNVIWGMPKKDWAPHTKFFTSEQQINEVVRILSDYKELHFWSINGTNERSFINNSKSDLRINPLIEVSKRLKKANVKFTAINSNKCDFLINGVIFRIINNAKVLKSAYTRDYPIVIQQRNQLAKIGNQLTIKDNSYNIGAIFFGEVPNTQESISGSIYVTSSGGPTEDTANVCDLISTNCEAAIVHAYVIDGNIFRFEREVIMF